MLNSKTDVKHRESNVELFRIIIMLLIVAHHYMVMLFLHYYLEHGENGG